MTADQIFPYWNKKLLKKTISKSLEKKIPMMLNYQINKTIFLIFYHQKTAENHVLQNFIIFTNVIQKTKHLNSFKPVLTSHMY